MSKVVINCSNLHCSEGSWRFKVEEEFAFAIDGLTLSRMYRISDGVPPDDWSWIRTVVRMRAAVEDPSWLGRGLIEFVVYPGYAWDGASGPAINTTTFRFPSLVHDVIYQAMREGIVEPTERNRLIADMALRELCLSGYEDGNGKRRRMSKLRAWWIFKAVQTFAKRPAKPIAKHPIEVILCKVEDKE